MWDAAQARLILDRVQFVFVRFLAEFGEGRGAGAQRMLEQADEQLDDQSGGDHGHARASHRTLLIQSTILRGI